MMMKLALICTRTIVCMLLLPTVDCVTAETTATQWTGSKNWDLLDVPARRAAWLWRFTGTAEGLPTDGAKPTAEQRAANKAVNRVWDGQPADQRFRENYKGSRDLFFDFCENKSIRVVYAYLSAWEYVQESLNEEWPDGDLEGWVKFNTEANKRGMQVWLMFYLWDDRDDARLDTDFEGIKYFAERVAAFNKKYPDAKFAGIHCDQEPDTPARYPGLLQSMKVAQEWVDANQAGILISQALRPRWNRDEVTFDGKTKTMNEHLLDIIDHSVLMCYSNNPKTIETLSVPLVQYATKHGKKLAIGFEVGDLKDGWEGAADETWFEEIMAEPLESRFKVDLKNKPLTFEDAMHQTANDLSASPGYDRMAIHSLESYFERWFDMEPRDYILGLPGQEYDTKQANTAKVDLHKDQQPLVGGDSP